MPMKIPSKFSSPARVPRSPHRSTGGLARYYSRALRRGDSFAKHTASTQTLNAGKLGFPHDHLTRATYGLPIRVKCWFFHATAMSANSVDGQRLCRA